MKNNYLQTYCFTGHRHLTWIEKIKLKSKLKYTIKSLIFMGYKYFGVGGAIGFDTLAEKTIIKLRKRYPHIRLILVIPFSSQAEQWSEKDKKTYVKIKTNADKIVYISEQYTKDCYQQRNRHLVDYSSLCVCYLKKARSGTQSTVNYARRKGLKVINLAP